jgi:putative signal transducing protein
MSDIEKTGRLSGTDLLEVAFADDPATAGMIQGLLEGGGIPSLLLPTGLNGPLLGIGLLPPGSQRVMVRAGQAADARRLLSEALVKEEREAAPEIAGSIDLDDTKGRRPRGYGLIGAYARIWLWSLIAVGATFGVFLLIRTG